jgi:hypothetical protein
MTPAELAALTPAQREQGAPDGASAEDQITRSPGLFIPAAEPDNNDPDS